MSTLHSTVKLYDLCTFALYNNETILVVVSFLKLETKANDPKWSRQEPEIKEKSHIEEKQEK